MYLPTARKLCHARSALQGPARRERGPRQPRRLDADGEKDKTGRGCKGGPGSGCRRPKLRQPNGGSERQVQE